MPNALAPPDKLCTVVRENGKLCGSVRLRGRDKCSSHAGSVNNYNAEPQRVVPSLTLPQLARLDLSDAASLSKLRTALIEHVMAGSLGQAEASSILRIAHEEHAASAKPKRSGPSLTDDISSRPPAAEPD